MKPSRPVEERLQSQVDRGMAAERLITDDVVLAWFDFEVSRLTAAMVDAPIEADETRRNAALEIRAVTGLRRHLEQEATLMRDARAKQERLANGRR